jgi:hypothetical protein
MTSFLDYDIVATIGPIGSGKDTTCNKLVTSHNFWRLDFKTAMLQALWKILGWEPQDLKGYEKFKKSKFENSSFADLNFSGRDLLERFATDCVRDYLGLNNIWMDLWNSVYLNYYQSKKVCIGDCRFENEVRFLIELSEKENKKLAFIFCDFKSSRYDNSGTHESRKLAQILKNLGCKDQQIISPLEMEIILGDF